MTLNEYGQEVLDYMVKKLPDANPATLCEIAEFFALKSHNYACDMVTESSKQWHEEFKRYEKQWDRIIERYYK